jgi:hypothetical protein
MKLKSVGLKGALFILATMAAPVAAHAVEDGRFDNNPPGGSLFASYQGEQSFGAWTAPGGEGGLISASWRLPSGRFDPIIDGVEVVSETSTAAEMAATGPEVGKGVVSFFAFLILLIAIRYRGLII